MDDCRIKETSPANWRTNIGSVDAVQWDSSEKCDVKPDCKANATWRNSCSDMKVMQISWKKEHFGDNPMYVNPFTIIDIEYTNDIQQWERSLMEFKSSESAMQSKKCNKVADKMNQRGYIELSNHNFDEALNYYNRALCFAEHGIFHELYECVAHVNRGMAFSRMEMYQKAQQDFEFASRKKCPEPLSADKQNLRVKCQKMDKNREKPSMKLTADKSFPCMASVLEIKYNQEYGRCVVAKKDIDIGQTVFVAEAFALAVTADKKAFCYTCHKTKMNFIACNNCSDVMFRDEECANRNSIHKMECCTYYHQINDLEVKFIIQTILVAIETFPNVDRLIEFVECVTSDGGCDRIPKSSSDSASKYGIFLKLTPECKGEHIFYAYKVFTAILLIPKVKFLFDSESKQRFLMHLTLHHTNVIPKNGFMDVAEFTDQFTVKYIFDVLSIINHSCVPNLYFSMVGKTGYCVTVRPIKKGDQVFINYLGDDVDNPTTQRRNEIKENWDFDCKCLKCEGISISSNAAVKPDPFTL